MNRRDSIGLIIVSVVAVILIIGLLFKAYDILSDDFIGEQNHVDSVDVKTYYEEIEQGPASVVLEGVRTPSPEKKVEVEEKPAPKKQEVKPVEEKVVKKYTDKVYIVVTGAFSSKTNANAWKEKLKAKSYKADIYFQSDRGLYLVYVNKFDSEAKASSYSQSLKAKGIDNHIKPIN